MKQMIKKDDFYISFIRDSMREKDIPFNRQVWNDTIDSMIRNGDLLQCAINWSYPKNRFFFYHFHI